MTATRLDWRLARWQAAWELIRAGDLVRVTAWAGRNTTADYIHVEYARQAYDHATRHTTHHAAPRQRRRKP